MPESINVPYDRHTEAHKWRLFAAHALAGLNAFPGGTVYRESMPGEAVRIAADQADKLLAEFKARFHFDPQADKPKEPPDTSTHVG